MTIYERSNNQVVFLYESGTYAVPSGASGLWFGGVTNNSISELQNSITLRYAGRNNRNFSQIVLGPEDYEGTLSFNVQNFRLFGLAMGSIVDVSGTASVHIISELNSDGTWFATSGTNSNTNFPSITIKDSKKGLSDGNQYVRTINGCVVDTYELTASQNNPVTADATYLGQSLTLGSKTTDIVSIGDEDTSRPYLWSDVVFTLAGATMTELNEIRYRLDNTIERRHYVNGSRVAQAFVPTSRNHSVDLTIDVNSNWYKTLNNYSQNGSVFNATLTLQQNPTEYGTFTFSGCEITSIQTSSEVEGLDNTTVTFTPRSVSFVGSDATRLYKPY
jgi:hypothetical protein